MAAIPESGEQGARHLPGRFNRSIDRILLSIIRFHLQFISEEPPKIQPSKTPRARQQRPCQQRKRKAPPAQQPPPESPAEPLQMLEPQPPEPPPAPPSIEAGIIQAEEQEAPPPPPAPPAAAFPPMQPRTEPPPAIVPLSPYAEEAPPPGHGSAALSSESSVMRFLEQEQPHAAVPSTPTAAAAPSQPPLPAQAPTPTHAVATGGAIASEDHEEQAMPAGFSADELRRWHEWDEYGYQVRDLLCMTTANVDQIYPYPHWPTVRLALAARWLLLGRDPQLGHGMCVICIFHMNKRRYVSPGVPNWCWPTIAAGRSRRPRRTTWPSSRPRT